MLVPQLYLNGFCYEAIELYKKAFKTDTDSMMFDPEKESEKQVIHAEMHILGSRIMFSDYKGSRKASADSTMEIVAMFENEEELRSAYHMLSEGSETIVPIGPTFYTSCLVSFVDKFGVRWCFMI